LLGAVGGDDFGHARLRDLRAEGIDTADIAELPGESSGVALIVVETGGENRIAYVPGATAAISAEAALTALRRLMPTVLLCTLELPLETLAALIPAAKRQGTRTVLCAAPEPEQARALLPAVDVLIVNKIEAAALLDLPDDALDSEELPGLLRALGPGTVILTLGKEGAAALIADQLVREPAIAIEVVDTTGAGDAFAGAFAAALVEERPMLEALQRGIVAGGLAASRPGAQPSMPTAAQIDQAIARQREPG
nr:bifunctional hydroxymethylpyrimidine kinase/phosphomethylpyrimidine kinase [Chloroflexia bacterium]